MQTTDFARLLQEFLASYIPSRGFSRHTLRSYRDCLKQFLKYCRDTRGMNILRLEMKDVTARLVEDFLGQLKNGRCAMSTYNQRLAAMRSFLNFALRDAPETLHENQLLRRLGRRKGPAPATRKLEADYIEALLRAPDLRTRRGRRDTTLMTVMYDLGLRVSELSGITVRDVRLDRPCHMVVWGKGGKQRGVPMHDGTARLLQGYMREWKLTTPDRLGCLLFPGHSRDGRLTTPGITYILQKYASLIRDRFPSVPPQITPHMLRHSKGMHLAREGVPVIYIRDMLGHEDVSTTDRYIRATNAEKAVAIERAIGPTQASDFPDWNDDRQIMEMLGLYG